MTNKLGEYSVKIKIIPGNPGMYIFSFIIGGIYTRAIRATTDFPVSEIVIMKQPKSFYDQ